jgi:hypothetical protein
MGKQRFKEDSCAAGIFARQLLSCQNKRLEYNAAFLKKTAFNQKITGPKQANAI